MTTQTERHAPSVALDASPIHAPSSAPKFSVIVATLNRGPSLLRALESILAQTLSEFELIIVDDASTDGTSENVAALADPRVVYLRQSANVGVGAARNRGIAKATGEIIVFVDDDDTIAPTFLEEVYTTLSHAPANVGFIWTWKQLVLQTEDGIQNLRLLTYTSTSTTPFPGTHYLNDPDGGSGGLAVRSEAIRAVEMFNPELRAVGDTELLMRLARCYDYIVIPRPLYFLFAHHGERLTKPSLRRAQAYERIIEIHHAWLPQYPGLLTVMYKGTARIYYQIGERDKGRAYMWKLLRYQPANWRNWILLLLLELLPILPPSLARRALAGQRSR